MRNARKRKPHRRRAGRVSYYPHHGSWWVYYRDGGTPVRKYAGPDEKVAEQVAAQVNAQLACAAPTLFSFTPTTVPELQRAFLEHHEYVLRSSLATVSRYRAATEHLVRFSQSSGRPLLAQDLCADAFVRHLRTIRISPNGHARSVHRPLRDKGVRFILETCRSMYGFATRQRRLPPYASNPFAGLGGKRIRIEDAKRIFVFDQQQAVAFFEAADAWTRPVHFLLAMTGMRPGELVSLLIEDIDLTAGWVRVQNKPELGWRTKTRRERQAPLIEEAGLVLRRVIGARRGGPVFLRPDIRPGTAPLSGLDLSTLAREAEQRLSVAEAAAGENLARAHIARLHRGVWRDAGAVRVDRVRLSFNETARACGLPEHAMPKSWRHSFATLLQDANVDPLVRQITLGHAPTIGPESALGMTSLYTHTRPETHRREIIRALQMWPSVLTAARRWLVRPGSIPSLPKI
ncbi:MAG: tyrosine-type recombinase/integrase [Pirellulales bacterium]|nr:tyrosine-type recombinase/integrase [Pirellulales bacterium]